MKTRAYLLFWLAVPLLITSCGTLESRKPLSPPETAVRDKRLEGLWTGADNNGTGYIYVAYRDKGFGSMVCFCPDGKTGVGSLKYDFFVTRTGTDEYLNLSNQEVHSSESAELLAAKHRGAYLFVKLHFLPSGELVYCPVSGEPFVEAIKRKKLMGKIFSYDKGNHVADVLLDDSAEDILAFIKSAKPDEVFRDTTTLRRVGGL